MARISSESENHWNPKYGEIDWYPMYEQMLEEEGEEPPLYLYYENLGYKFQLTEANTFVYLNRVAPNMNGVAIVDPLDNCAWWWFADLHEEYEELEDLVAPIATIISSDIPQESAVKNYLLRTLKDIVSVDYIPEEWEDEGDMDR
jgi:hypothetical protein